MATKVLLFICAQALFIQISLQAIIPTSKISGNSYMDNIVIGGGSSGFGTILGSSGIGSGLIGSGLVSGASGFGSGIGNGLTVGSLGTQNIVSGGPLLVTAISPIGPSGLAVASENLIEGVLTVNGQLPYLSAVAFEGSLPTAGSGTATCGCGSGTVGITSEGLPNRGRGLY